jgi:hypothetical protein
MVVLKKQNQQKEGKRLVKPAQLRKQKRFNQNKYNSFFVRDSFAFGKRQKQTNVRR